MGQDRKERHLTKGTMKGRKAVRVDVTEGKSITGKITSRKVSKENEARKKGKQRRQP